MLKPRAIINESMKNNFALSFDSWYTDLKVVNEELEFQVNVGNAKNVNSPKYLIAAHQSFDRIGVPNKTRKIAIFDNLDVTKYFTETDGQRYPQDVVNSNYVENDFLDQTRDLELFYKEHVGKE